MSVREFPKMFEGKAGVKHMFDKGDWILLESNGVKEKYVCTKNNEIIEAIGTVAVPRENKIKKYKGIVTWSKEKSTIKQVLAVKKICKGACTMSDEELLKIAKNTENWEFGEFFGVEAMRIMEAAKQEHLNVEMVDTEIQLMINHYEEQKEFQG